MTKTIITKAITIIHISNKLSSFNSNNDDVTTSYNIIILLLTSEL